MTKPLIPRLDLAPLEAAEVDPLTKGLPFDAGAVTMGEIAAQGWGLLAGDLPLPAAVIRQEVLAANSAWMAGFTEANRLLIAPHGKTTMAPQLYDLQIADGAWAITVATVQQLAVCRRFGVARVVLANQPVGALEVDACMAALGVGVELYCLADSAEGVARLAEGAVRIPPPQDNPLRVLVEVGFAGGRTGCRTRDEAIAVAQAVAATPGLALAGIECFEGVLPNADAAGRLVDEVIALGREVLDRSLLPEGAPMVLSAGGSAFFDRVGERLRPVEFGREVLRVLRSGCYLTHDAISYAAAFRRIRDETTLTLPEGGLEPALEVWARVQSRPDPDKAILTMGKRDVGWDAGLPLPIGWHRAGMDAPQPMPEGHEVQALNDQHCHMTVPQNSPLAVGDIVGFGIGHPCTTFDRWQLLMLVDESYRVTGAIRTISEARNWRPRMRIALIHVAQETNDFNPVPTTLDDYRAFGILEGREVLRSTRDQVAGWLAAVEASGREVETIPILRAFAVAGGRVSREAFDYFNDKIREGLAAAGRIDGLMLQLHGACAAEGVDDVEGEQAALCRQILGPDVPIVLALDHHANITAKLIKSCDAIVGHRTQPHDLFDTGRIGGEVMLRVAGREVRPVTAWRKIPLLSHQEQFLTSKGPMKAWFDRARALEADPRVIQVSNYPMQPWLDVAEGGWSTIVVTDGDAETAERLADEMADLAWSMRDDFQVREAIGVDDAVRAADAAPEGVVVLSDTGDTVFGGAAGDSNLILESILRLGIESRVLIPMISRQAVARLAEAGEGAEVTLTLGGDSAPEFFTPIEVTGTVRKIADGSRVRVSYNHQDEVNMGRVAIFETGPVTLMISELRGVAGNLPDVYRFFGIEPQDYKMAVLKTASNFQYFTPIASEVIRADTRGPGQSDVFTLPWKRIPRPVYPLDRVDGWREAHPANRGAAKAAR